MDADLSYFDKLDTPFRDIGLALHQLVREEAPQLRMAVRWGFPSFVGHKDVVSVMQPTVGARGHINLQFHFGAELKDPYGLMEGTGKTMRHIKFKSMADVGRSGVREAISAAAKFDEALGT